MDLFIDSTPPHQVAVPSRYYYSVITTSRPTFALSSLSPSCKRVTYSFAKSHPPRFWDCDFQPDIDRIGVPCSHCHAIWFDLVLLDSIEQLLEDWKNFDANLHTTDA